MAAIRKNSKIITNLTKIKPVQFASKRNLNLQEYHSKNILQQHQVAVQNFCLLDAQNQNSLNNFKAKEYVVKAQILAGGRGKGHFDNGFKGGVHVTKSPEEVIKLAKNMIGHRLITKQTPKEGILVEKIMVAESVNIKRETYLCILMERAYNGPVIIASPAGGMDIETVAEETPELIMKVPVDIFQGISDKTAEDIGKFLKFDGELLNKCSSEIKKLWSLFLSVEATQLEINPLVETDDGRVVSVDAKINFDDNAKFRHQDIFQLDDISGMDPKELEAARLNLTYIDLDGNIGCMVNGAGLAMGTMDLISLNGGTPANFLDLGGGVGQAQVSAAFNLLESDPKVNAIFINIFGGIVNCATIAAGIIGACKLKLPKNPVVVRLEGTNSVEARRLLIESKLPLHIIEDADQAAKMAVKLAGK